MPTKKTTKVEPKKETVGGKLNKPLPKKAIKQREGGRGKMLDYLEGWWVKQNANRIFGINNWSYEPLWESMKHIELPEYKNRKGELKKTGLYTVFVKLIVTVGEKEIVKSDIGSTQYYGEESKEMAIKGCVTDALKRCFASFGEQFGLLLYDKGHSNQKQQKVIHSSQIKSGSSQEELMTKYGMNTAQVTPKCPSCGAVMKIVERKDKTGIFWSCQNWRTKGCKGYSIDEVDLDGTITMKGAKPKPAPKKQEEVDGEDVPF